MSLAAALLRADPASVPDPVALASSPSPMVHRAVLRSPTGSGRRRTPARSPAAGRLAVASARAPPDHAPPVPRRAGPARFRARAPRIRPPLPRTFVLFYVWTAAYRLLDSSRASITRLQGCHAKGRIGTRPARPPRRHPAGLPRQRRDHGPPVGSARTRRWPARRRNG